MKRSWFFGSTVKILISVTISRSWSMVVTLLGSSRVMVPSPLGAQALHPASQARRGGAQGVFAGPRARRAIDAFILKGHPFILKWVDHAGFRSRSRCAA